MRIVLGKHLDLESYDPNSRNKTTLGELKCGPKGFLNWFGGILGAPKIGDGDLRVLAYQYSLKNSEDNSFFTQSFLKDPSGVARRLLAVRDDIYLSASYSFDMRKISGLSARLASLARVENSFQEQKPPAGESDQLSAILKRLKQGVSHPVQSLMLIEAPEAWPTLWQEVWAALRLSRVNITSADPLFTTANRGDLSQVQRSLRSPGAKQIKFQGDGTFVAIGAAFVSQAADVVATLVDQSKGGETAIIRGKEPRALDMGLGRAGIALLGHQEETPSHAMGSFLPLLFNLSHTPVNPSSLRDFLVLEPSPLPKSLRLKILSHLDRNPRWSTAIAHQVIADYTGGRNATDEGEPTENLNKLELTKWLTLEDDLINNRLDQRKILLLFR